MGGNLNKQQQQIIAVVFGLVGLIYVYWTYMLSPTMKEIAKKETENQDLLSKIATAERQARRLPALKAEKEKLEIELAKLETQLPRQQDIPNIIRSITTEALAEDISFDRLTPKPVKTQNFFRVIPYDLQISGNLNSLARFLSQLGQQDRIYKALSLRLSPKGPTDTGIINLTINLTIETFAYTGAG